MPTYVVPLLLIIGILMLIAGVSVGLSEGNDERRSFAAWVTIIGTGFIIAGLVVAFRG